ncbi:probable arabinosyltransferase ARAD1 [Brassica napus]|nr:probable arabinosyltransferase ARAD1 [Brassica napus]
MSSIHPVQSNFLIPNKPNQTKNQKSKTEMNSLVVFFVGRVTEVSNRTRIEESDLAMVGNQRHHTPHRPRSKTLIFTLLLFSISLLVILYTFSSSSRPSISNPNKSDRTETSFVASLEQFLIHKAPKLSIRDDTVHGESDDDDLKKLDEKVFERENRLLIEDPVYPIGFPVKVYVYEMPKKFTFDLLWLFRNTYKETSNATSNGSPVHRLIEQHSVDYWLWADLISPESERRLKSVVRVHQQHEADFFYVPFFTTISFFLLEKQQCKAFYREALKWVTDQPAWKRSEGRDHIFPIHHPWSFKTVRKFVKNAIWLLPDMDSTGNWYKPGQVSLEKDLILPYVPNVDRCDDKCLSESAPKRTTLLFFRGRLKRNAGGKIRAKLGAELSGVKDVIITEGTSGEGGKLAAQGGMRRSLFCLCPAGDTPSSARLFDAIVSGCIPVIVSDELELPFEGILDYKKVAVIVSSSDAIQPGWLVNHLRSFIPSQVKKFQSSLAQYSRHFVYSSPAQPLGPEDLTWRMIAGKLVNIKLHTRRSLRVVKGSRSICRCDCWRPNSTTAANSLSPVLS